jgi:hypothetical protein
VVENKIDEKMLAADENAFLASFKTKSVTEFKQKIL